MSTKFEASIYIGESNGIHRGALLKSLDDHYINHYVFQFGADELADNLGLFATTVVHKESSTSIHKYSNGEYLVSGVVDEDDEFIDVKIERV